MKRFALLCLALLAGCAEPPQSPPLPPGYHRLQLTRRTPFAGGIPIGRPYLVHESQLTFAEAEAVRRAECVRWSSDFDGELRRYLLRTMPAQ